MRSKSCWHICRRAKAELQIAEKSARKVDRNAHSAVQKIYLQIYAQILANCANLYPSFETDWFSARLYVSTPDLDLAANSFVLRNRSTWNREQ
jgi:hypothetical protein